MIDKAPSFNSALRYLRDPDMTPVLTSLIEVSSLPLRARRNAVRGGLVGVRDRQHQDLVLAEARPGSHPAGVRQGSRQCGTSTHVVTAAEVTASNVNDAPMLPELLATTAGNFPAVREVAADKGYLSRANCEVVEKYGATPYMPFKVNTVAPPEGTAWARMYHLYSYRSDEFLTHYHRRSNVETVFAMIKAKFGDDIHGKTLEGQTNEVLAKVVAHNLCVLIQSFHELGIEPTFDSVSAPARKLLEGAQAD